LYVSSDEYTIYRVELLYEKTKCILQGLLWKD